MGNRCTAGALAGFFLLASTIAAMADACRADVLEWRGPKSSARFNVELADTPDRRATGLMFRETMPKSSGMLFVYPVPQEARFWMKNTLIPLDMIFADEAGRVTVVHSNAVPKDETPIDGGTGVKYVLEINGGLARAMGITPGTEFRNLLIDPALAVWPCTE